MATSWDVTFDDFINGRLPLDAWTHEAHLITCWVALQTRTPAEALAFLREAIQTHNCGIGIRNTDTEGYHETLTVYYVTAVAAADAPDPDALNEVPTCRRTAPLDFWSRYQLFSIEARRGWLEPDIGPLPWDVTTTRFAPSEGTQPAGV